MRVDGLHLTLRFLGPTPATRQAELEAVADSVAGAAAPFEARLSGGGAFPSLARPRSLWVGVAAGHDELARLADALTAAVIEGGQAVETRPFAAHLTLGANRWRPPGAGGRDRDPAGRVGDRRSIYG